MLTNARPVEAVNVVSSTVQKDDERKLLFVCPVSGLIDSIIHLATHRSARERCVFEAFRGRGASQQKIRKEKTKKTVP